jgi:hypothetical protein
MSNFQQTFIQLQGKMYSKIERMNLKIYQYICSIINIKRFCFEKAGSAELGLKFKL